MPFTAQYHGYRVDATNFPGDLWSELKGSVEKHDLLCPDPDCNVQMIPKTYHRTGTRFFAHKAESQCPMSKGMTPEHLMLQNLVQKSAIGAGWKTEKEVYLPELRHEPKRFVDVLAISSDDPNCRIAFEIQWSNQTPEAYIERTQDYIKRGIRTYWISRTHLDRSYLDRGVCSWTLTDDYESVYYHVNSINKLALSIKDFVKKVLSPDGAFVERCGFTEGFHFCEGVECAMSEGESQHNTRINNANLMMDVLLRYLKAWNEALTSKYLWKTLDHIAQKERLTDVRDILEALASKGFRYENQDEVKKGFFGATYFPPTLPKLCEFLWKTENLYHKLTRTPAYDPRLDYGYWECFCDWKHLEIGYRLLQGNKRTNYKPVRVNVIRCSKCGAMHSGAGPHKKRIKAHLLRKAKRYELVSGHLDKKYRPKGKGYKGREVHPDAPIE